MSDPLAHLRSRFSGHGAQPAGLTVSSIHWHLGKSIPWFYGTGIAIGMPFLTLVQPLVIKLWFALLWAIWSIVYLWLSQRELEFHARRYGSLTEKEVNDQIGDPWKIWIGVLIAIMVWIVARVGGWSWLWYGPVELAVIASAIITGFIEKHLTNAWILRYQAAVAGQKRYEDERTV